MLDHFLSHKVKHLRSNSLILEIEDSIKISLKNLSIVSSSCILCKRLSASIPTVNNNVGSRCVCACVTREVKIDAFELSWIAVSLQRCQAKPLLLHFKRAISTHGGVNIAWADRINTGKVSPLHSKGLGQLNNTCFASIVTGLKYVSYVVLKVTGVLIMW